MSPAQREAYEEMKLKMRKAIADPDLVDETEQVSYNLWSIVVGCAHFAEYMVRKESRSAVSVSIYSLSLRRALLNVRLCEGA